MLIESRNIPEFGRARSKHILFGSSTVEHRLFRSSTVETYLAWIAHGCAHFIVEHGPNIPKFGPNCQNISIYGRDCRKKESSTRAAIAN